MRGLSSSTVPLIFTFSADQSFRNVMPRISISVTPSSNVIGSRSGAQIEHKGSVSFNFKRGLCSFEPLGCLVLFWSTKSMINESKRGVNREAFQRSISWHRKTKRMSQKLWLIFVSFSFQKENMNRGVTK